MKLFWHRYEEFWGPASERPESYWAPWLGDLCGLRPGDIGSLTLEQLDACRDYLEARNNGV